MLSMTRCKKADGFELTTAGIPIFATADSFAAAASEIGGGGGGQIKSVNRRSKSKHRRARAGCTHGPLPMPLKTLL